VMPQNKRQHKSGEGVQALFRLEDGQVVLEDIADTGIFSGEDVARFRQAMAIKDPDTREVIGYEMEPITRAAR
jgi:ectoine hydroxylase-related dioxygenase (phytanoyl-CoA dioxygenase family)